MVTRIELMAQKQDQIQSSLQKDYSESNKTVSINLASGKTNIEDEQIN